MNQTKYEYKLLSKEEVLKYINEKLAEGDVKTFKERKEEFLRMHSIHSEVEVRFKVGNDIIKVLSKIEKVYDGGDVEVSYTDKKTGTVQRKEFSAREILKWNKNKMAKAKISQGQQGKELKEKKQELKTEVESKLDQNSPERNQKLNLKVHQEVWPVKTILKKIKMLYWKFRTRKFSVLSTEWEAMQEALLLQIW